MSQNLRVLADSIWFLRRSSSCYHNLLYFNVNANVIFVIPLEKGLTKFFILHMIKLTKNPA